MAEDEKTEDSAVGAPAKSSGAAESSQKSPFVTFILLLNMIALATVAYFQYTFMQAEANKPSLRQLVKEEMSGDVSEEASDEQAEINRPKGIVMPLEGFTVNLAKGDGPRRFVRLKAVLKFSESSKEAEFTARKPQIRDTIISILNSKRPEDLLKREGKEFLKEEIKSAINSFLIDGEVIDVFYVGFQIN